MRRAQPQGHAARPAIESSLRMIERAHARFGITHDGRSSARVSHGGSNSAGFKVLAGLLAALLLTPGDFRITLRRKLARSDGWSRQRRHAIAE